MSQIWLTCPKAVHEDKPFLKKLSGSLCSPDLSRDSYLVFSTKFRGPFGFKICNEFVCEKENTGFSFKVDTDRNPKPNLLLPTSTSSIARICPISVFFLDLQGKIELQGKIQRILESYGVKWSYRVKYKGF